MICPRPRSNARCRAVLSLSALLVVLSSGSLLRADEPYARTRDYDLQHSRIALRFETARAHVRRALTFLWSLAVVALLVTVPGAALVTFTRRQGWALVVTALRNIAGVKAWVWFHVPADGGAAFACPFTPSGATDLVDRPAAVLAQ